MENLTIGLNCKMLKHERYKDYLCYDCKHSAEINEDLFQCYAWLEDDDFLDICLFEYDKNDKIRVCQKYEKEEVK